MTTAMLLGPNDPEPVELLNPDSSSPLLLVCEHAGQAIPESLGDLGVTQDVIDSHRGWDIGAEALARALAERLDAPLVMQRFSRLVIDCNRPPDGPHAIPDVSDGVVIPANHGLNDGDCEPRRAAIFRPYDAALNAAFTRHPRRLTLSIHSYTDQLGEQRRPWHAGFLARKDRETRQLLRDHIAAADPSLILAINEPYQIDDETDWFIPVHAERRNLAHCLIEVRNDGLLTPAGIERWSDRLGNAIASLPELQP